MSARDFNLWCEELYVRLHFLRAFSQSRESVDEKTTLGCQKTETTSKKTQNAIKKQVARTQHVLYTLQHNLIKKSNRALP